MEKDIGKIKKNDDTDILIRIDDFGGNPGLTIREFVKSENYTGFTKAGVRIKADNFDEFKKMINSIKPDDLKNKTQTQKTKPIKPSATNDDNAGIDEEGLM
ncbi:MAG: hypothetical protein V1889_01480 [archaeon]